MKLFPRKIKLKLPRSLPKFHYTALAGTVVTAAALLFCAWLPSRFIGDREGSASAASPETSSASMTHIELWEAYREGTLSAQSVEIKKEEMDLCVKLAADIRSRLTLDIGTGRRTAEGEECLRVGKRLTLYHCWEEWTGDWGNWLEIFINMDSQEVYYFYISSSCVQNYDRYSDAISRGFNAESAAKLWGDVLGIGVPAVGWSGNPDEPAEADYGTARYRINAKYYFDAGYPTGLFDLKAVIAE